jgi:hypothetical protein
MSKIIRRGRGSFRTVVSQLQEELLNSALSIELVDSQEYLVGDAHVGLYVYDKYYWRAGNRASLSVSVVENEGRITVCAIGSGGGQGAFFRFSWGAESDFAETVGAVLDRMGFSG